MKPPTIHRRRRVFTILRLFFGLVADFLFQYARARIAGRPYDFFQDSQHNRKRATRIRETALSMGGLLIKVGQFLSSRVDLLPREYIEELALLQDEVPSVPFDQIRAIVEAELGAPIDQLFPQFERDPIAAASLGQVHAGRTPSGARVAVKVQRPGIAQIVDADLFALRYIVGWLDRHTPIGRRVNLKLVLREFEDTLRLELDYRREAHHAERFAVLFHESTEVLIPRIYWSRTTTRVLCMQFMEGIKVTDFADLDRAGISRSVVAEILLRAYLVQIVEDGFFHADPHPGNILVRPGPQVVLLDHGMVGEISPQVRENLRRIFLAAVRRDYEQILVSLDRLGFVPPTADVSALRRVVAWAIDTFYDMSFAELQAVDPVAVLDRLQEVIYTESVRIPPNFAFLGRALGTLSGLCTALDPSFQFTTVAEPFARRLIAESRGIDGIFGQVRAEARSLASTAYALPYLARGALERVQQGELDFHRELGDVVSSLERVERAMRRLLHGLMLAAFLLAGAILFPTHFRILSWGAFAISLVLLISVFSPFRRGRR